MHVIVTPNIELAVSDDVLALHLSDVIREDKPFPLGEPLAMRLIDILRRDREVLIQRMIEDAAVQIRAHMEGPKAGDDIMVELDQWLHSKGIMLVAKEPT